MLIFKMVCKVTAPREMNPERGLLEAARSGFESGSQHIKLRMLEQATYLSSPHLSCHTHKTGMITLCLLGIGESLKRQNLSIT